MNEELVSTQNEITQNAKNTALLSWIGTLFLGFIPGLILYFIKQDDEYIRNQAKEALNWSITAIIANMVAFMLSFILIGLFLFPVIGICHFVFCIMGAVSTSRGNNFRAPFTIRLIK